MALPIPGPSSNSANPSCFTNAPPLPSALDPGSCNGNGRTLRGRRMPNNVPKWAFVSGRFPGRQRGPNHAALGFRRAAFVRVGGQAAYLYGMDAETIVLRARWLPACEFGWTGGK